jgi:hypothetical protein
VKRVRREPDEVSLPSRTAARCSAERDSSIVRRSQSTIRAATPPMKKPTRQPQSLIEAGATVVMRMRRVNWARTWPPTSVTYWKEEKKPRRFRVAASDM